MEMRTCPHLAGKRLVFVTFIFFVCARFPCLFFVGFFLLFLSSAACVV